MIKVTVILRSVLKTKLKKEEIILELEDNSTITDLATKLAEQFGKEVRDFLLDNKTNNVIAMFSCNKQRCTKDHILKDGDIVSIFPAISGG